MNEARGLWLARGVLAAGIIASLALVTQSPSKPVFWSGDGGLKHMMAEQFANGQFHVDLRLTDDPSIQQLWDEGLHPGVHNGYVFHRNGKYYGVFPYPFSFVSAPFYALFGMRGYYIIPMLSLWGIWIVVYLALRRTCIESWMIALLMGACMFATPLMLYGAAFWEHTLGIFLAFAPIMFTLRHDDNEPGTAGPLAAGAMLGLSVWIRPEMVALMAALLPIAFVWRTRALGFRGWFIFSAASVGAVLSFFALNFWIYGHPLGTHGLQVFSIYPPPTRPDIVLKRFLFITHEVWRYTPTIAFTGFVVAVALWKGRVSWRSELVYLILVTSLFYLMMIYMVPSNGDFQPGPRFALLPMTLTFPITAYAWKSLPSKHVLMRLAGVGLLLLGTAAGVKRSAIQQSQWVIGHYRERVLPAYEFVAKRPETVIAVSHVKLTLELCGLIHSKTFFAAVDDEHFEQLIAALRARGVDRFLYIAEGDPENEYDSPIKHAVASSLKVEPLDRHGAHFYCYSVTIPPAP